MSGSRFFVKADYLSSLAPHKNESKQKHTDEDTNENEIYSINIKNYMVLNNDLLNVIVCKCNVPLVYIHTKYCYSTLSHAKQWKINCSKCKIKLRNSEIWHCRCEAGKCKLHYNFCQNCYKQILEEQKQRQKLIINFWKNKHVKQWVMNTKWLNVPKKDINNFKKFIANQIFNSINGKQLLNLTASDIINLSHKLPHHWQNGFKSKFCLNSLDKLYKHYESRAIHKESRVQQFNEISTENNQKIITLTAGYLYQITMNRSRNVGIDIIFLISKYMNPSLILNKFDLKILNEEKIYIFDEIVMQKRSKLIIGPKVKGIHVLNDITMKNKSVITSNTHYQNDQYEQPANINIKCDGNIIINGGLIDMTNVPLTYRRYEGKMNIICNTLKMENESKIRCVQYSVTYYMRAPSPLYKHKAFGDINIKMKGERDIQNWYNKVKTQFDPAPNINGLQIDAKTYGMFM